MPAEIDAPCIEALDECVGTKVVIPGTNGIQPVLETDRGRKRDKPATLLVFIIPIPS